jgi:hypothetical protein
VDGDRLHKPYSKAQYNLNELAEMSKIRRELASETTQQKDYYVRDTSKRSRLHRPSSSLVGLHYAFCTNAQSTGDQHLTSKAEA